MISKYIRVLGHAHFIEPLPYSPDYNNRLISYEFYSTL